MATDHISVNTNNPDAASLNSSAKVDISYNTIDLNVLQSDSIVGASMLYTDIDQSTSVVQVPTVETALTGSQYYFTPIYTTTLNYIQWRSIDKNFSEL